MSVKSFKQIAADVSKHEIFLLAASLAYTTALALAPFLLIILSLASLLSQDTQQRLFSQLSSSLGEKTGAVVKGVMENADNHPHLSGVGGFLGFLVLAFSASAIFSQLRIALDKVNEHKDSQKGSGVWLFIKDKLLSIGLVFGFAFLSIVSLLVTTVLSLLYPASEGWLWYVLEFCVNFFIFAALFAAMYRFVPSDKAGWQRCLISGAVSSVFYLIGKLGIGLYLGKAGLESAYGAAGSLVVFLAWVYYAALMVLVSYEFSNHLIFHKPAGKNAVA